MHPSTLCLLPPQLLALCYLVPTTHSLLNTIYPSCLLLSEHCTTILPITTRKALGENIYREDARRANFVQRRLKEDSEVPSITIRKFIGTLRKAVRVNMRYKGGTPYSIIRNLFLYWDKDKHGSLGVNELSHVMHSIGCRLTDEDLRHIVTYYDNGMKEGEMSYEELLHDIGRGEPTIIEFTPTEDANDHGLRFENVTDDWESMPESVVKFLEAFREFIARRMRVSGGTCHASISQILQRYQRGIDP